VPAISRLLKAAQTQVNVMTVKLTQDINVDRQRPEFKVAIDA